MEITHPDDLEADRALLNQTLAGDIDTYQMDKRYIRKDGSLVWISLTVTLVRAASGDPSHFISVIQDIGEKMQARQAFEMEALRLETQLGMQQMIGAPEEQLFAFVLDAIVATTPGQFAFIGLLDDAETTMTIHAWSKDVMAQCAVETEPMHFSVAEAGLWVECVRQRRPVIVNAYADETGKRGYPQGHVPIERFMAVPVFDGERVAAVTAVANKSDDFTQTDGDALVALANRMWEILRRNRKELEIKEYAASLEAVNQIMTGREERIVALKAEIHRLEALCSNEAVRIEPPPPVEDEPPASPPLSAGEQAVGISAGAPRRTGHQTGNRLRWLAALVLLAGLATTIFAWRAAHDQALQRARNRFDVQVANIETALRKGLRTYENMLISVAGLFAASDQVTRTEFRAYVEALRIEQVYPGAQGVGFSLSIPAAEKEAHIRQIRAEGFPEYTLRPVGERPEYTAIVFLEPFDWRNQRAFGYDMFSEPIRRQAMIRARDTGLPAMSGKVFLVQETDQDVQAGFLIYVPVYHNQAAVQTHLERRAALVGYVYSPFRMHDFLAGLALDDPQGVIFEVYDGGQMEPEMLLFESRARMSGPKSPPARFVHRLSIAFAGAQWLLVFSSTPESTIDLRSPLTIFWFGLLASLLLPAAVLLFDRAYRQARRLADMASDMINMNRQLSAEVTQRKNSEAELRSSLKDLRAINETMTGREERIIQLKEEINRLLVENGREPRYAPVWRVPNSEQESPKTPVSTTTTPGRQP